jgi:CBS domain-containing protein
MVKSYVAAQKKEPKFKEQAILVKDFMTKRLITFLPGDSMHDVIESLVSHGISGAPVIDDKGNLVGVVSEGDCLKQVVRGKYLNTPEIMGTVSEYMTPDPVCVSPNENIMEVANKFLNMRLRRFPVLEGEKLVGQISQRDVMAAIQNLEHERWH